MTTYFYVILKVIFILPFQVLADFPHATSRLELDHLFEVFQPIRPRAYSISSSVEVIYNNIFFVLFWCMTFTLIEGNEFFIFF